MALPVAIPAAGAIKGAAAGATSFFAGTKLRAVATSFGLGSIFGPDPESPVGGRDSGVMMMGLAAVAGFIVYTIVTED